MSPPPELPPEKLPVPTRERWQLLRAGIQNVWEYDHQTRFVFHRGRLLLRGQNESGKTKALEVLLPFLLDASLAPQRLDPFGSNARAMRWNLLNDSNPDVTIAIGYVWLELGRLEGGAPRYWTVGAGLKARRTAQAVEDWYFATPLRVDEELSLLDDKRVPRTRAQLEEALGDGGQVFDRAVDYRRALNEKLFGLPQDQYGALVDALLQLRRPQLSKQLDPEELSRLLSASLPPLDSAVIGSLAEGFERLDRHRAEREEYHQALGTLRDFLKVYGGYVGSFVKARALELTRAESAYHAARAEFRQAGEAKQQAELRLGELSETIERLEAEGLALDERLRTLRESDAFRAVAALDQAEAQARKARTLAERMQQSLAKALQRAQRSVAQAKEAEQEAKAEAEAAVRQQAQAQAAAADAVLEAHHAAILAAVERDEAATAQDALATALRMRAEQLDRLRALTRQVAEAERAIEQAMARVKLAEEQLRAAAERLAQAEEQEKRVREEFLDGVARWAEGCEELTVDLPVLLEEPPERMRPSLEPAILAARRAREEEARAAALDHDRTAQAHRELALEREAVASTSDHPPPSPVWRSPRGAERPGAPLYRLCEFRAGVAEAARAGFEAALEAAGLLDAWVLPEGEVLDGATREVLIQPAPLEGATLLDVLEPVAGEKVAPEVIAAVLRSIALDGSGRDAAAGAWVAEDGRFALGPLQGQSEKEVVAYLGAGAREQARQRRLAELDAQLAALSSTLAAQAEALALAQARGRALEDEVARFPELTALMAQQATSRARADELAQARVRHGEETSRLQALEARHGEALARREAAAAEAGLRGWVDRLEELANRTSEYGRQMRAALDAIGRGRRSAQRAAQRRADATEDQSELERSQAEAAQSSEEATRAQARAQALRESVGQTRDELLESLRQGDARLEEVGRELKTARGDQSAANQALGALRSAEGAAEERVGACDRDRREADGRLREAAGHGLFAVVGVQVEKPPQEWSFTDALLAARRADELTGKVDPSEQARDKAWNKVGEKHQDLMRALPPEIRVIPEQLAGLMLYRGSFNARALTLMELLAELEADVATRDRLLGEDERRLFESFLTGEAHEHLREQLRQATALVKRMNRQLQDHPTSSGMQMRLQWEVAEDAAPGTGDAVALLFKSGALLSDADRSALQAFLRQRLEDARARTEARTLQEQLMSVLDYRAWHTFEVQCRGGAEGWKRLTRKVHAAGSGGQKAVMLHLPLFAAAAAFFDSAPRPGAPRLILLDEAFAGIDRETRGQLMGLLSEFDLDFVMTSFEEWGFYPQLDGLSTYHLAREKGMPGVYSDWFVWNGREAIQVHPA